LNSKKSSLGIDINKIWWNRPLKGGTYRRATIDDEWAFAFINYKDGQVRARTGIPLFFNAYNFPYEFKQKNSL
jgi:hypothetical protein